MSKCYLCEKRCMELILFFPDLSEDESIDICVKCAKRIRVIYNNLMVEGRVRDDF